MLNALHNNKKLKYIAGAAAILLLLIIFMLYNVSNNAAKVFNVLVSQQTIFKGKIVAEDLKCDLAGNITFNNLNWTTDNNEPIVKIPNGRIKFAIHDLLTMKVSPDTIKEIELHNAALRLLFDNDMKLDVLRQDIPVQVPNEQPKAEVPAQPQQKKHHQRNLNLPDKLPNWKVIVVDCSVDAYHKDRRYLTEDVDFQVDISKHELLKLKFSSGPLGGTMIGKGIEINGQTNLHSEETNMKIRINDIVPSSLGLGNLTNAVNIDGELTGKASAPVLTGKISFDILEVKPFVFTEVSGNFHCQGGVVNVTNTKGRCYGGAIDAQGKYGLDSHRYKIDAVAHSVNISQMPNLDKLDGVADLKFIVLCDPKTKNTVISGDFSIGKGKVAGVPFKSATGSLFSHNKDLFFKNVKLNTGLGKISSHAFSIENGKLHTKPHMPNEEVIIAELERI